MASRTVSTAAGFGASSVQPAGPVDGASTRATGPVNFYDGDADGLPRFWPARIRASICMLALGFCAGRMLDDYLERIYTPTRTSA